MGLRKKIILPIAGGLVTILAACNDKEAIPIQDATNTPTFQPEATVTAEHDLTPEAYGFTVTPTYSPVPTLTPQPDLTATPTSEPTQTPTPTPTGEPVSTPTDTPDPTPSPTPIQTVEPTPTPTPIQTATPSPTPSPTPTPLPALIQYLNDNSISFSNDVIDVFMQKYSDNLTDNRKAIINRVGENEKLQNVSVLETLLKYDDKFVRAVAEDTTRYVDENGLTDKAKTILEHSDKVFSYEPMRESLRFDDKWSHTDVQAFLELYSTWNPNEEISREAVNATLDNVTDEQLRLILPHVVNVTYVENYRDGNGNRITPSSITQYDKEELEWLVSYDRPVGPYEHYAQMSANDPSRLANRGETERGEIIWVPVKGSNNGWVWQSRDENNNLVSAHLKAQEILNGNYESVSDDPNRAALEQFVDWGRKNSVHYATGNNNIYAEFGYPWGAVVGVPVEDALSVQHQGLYVGGSHLSSALLVSMLRNLNIPAQEVHVHNDPEVNKQYPYAGHGALKAFLGNDVRYMEGNFVYDFCLKPPIPINKLLLDQQQFDELKKDIVVWRLNYDHEVNPEKC